jgi:hypothetical protein
MLVKKLKLNTSPMYHFDWFVVEIIEKLFLIHLALVLLNSHARKKIEVKYFPDVPF